MLGHKLFEWSSYVDSWVLVFHISKTPYMVPTGTGKQGKPGKMGRHFPVREFCQGWKSQGKVKIFTQNTGKIRKNYAGKLEKTLEKPGNLSASNRENPANMLPHFK